MKKRVLLFFLLLCTVSFAADPQRVIYSASGGRVKSLDPAYADDLASRNLLGAVYDTLLEYDYDQRPYQLKPAMLKKMPEFSPDGMTCRFELRSDLYFADDPVFKGKKVKVTSRDVLFSILRIADARNHSPLYWLYRGKIRGLERFRQESAKLPKGDNSIYDRGISGFVIHSDSRFDIHFTRRESRFLYMLAMPNAGIVSRQAAEHYQERYARHPAGSGAFVLKEWINDFRIILERNPDYRRETYPNAESPADRSRPLPLADRIEIRLIKQPMTSWLLFLQGNLDFHALDKDNADLAGSGSLPPVLAKRRIKLLRIPEFEIRYVGFNFSDPVLGKNLKLRQALSLAYNVPLRVEHSGNQLIPVSGPLPPGVPGYAKDLFNPWANYNLVLAKQLLAEAGYPGGIDPATGKPLQLTFDQTGNTPVYRQLGELAAADFAKLGIEVIPVLNNNPRFYEKLRQGKMQLFRLSWIGDYPDAENFLQLFYSGNRGVCNRTGFGDPRTDELYRRIASMPDSPEREKLCREMSGLIVQNCVWIYEGIPVSWQLQHCWLENYRVHDFAFARWKYLSVDPEKRRKMKQTFTPAGFRELNRRSEK